MRPDMRFALVRHLLLILALPIVPCAAQASWRLSLAVPGEWRPAVLAGLEDRWEIGDATTYVDSLGVTHRSPPKFLLSAMGLAGATYDRGTHATSALRPTAQGQLGVLYRATPGMRVGAYAVGLAEPSAVGGLVRVEPMSAAAIQVGWLRRTGDHANIALGEVEVALAFLTDLLRGGAH
jgi:hypothetical protein